MKLCKAGEFPADFELYAYRLDFEYDGFTRYDVKGALILPTIKPYRFADGYWLFTELEKRDMLEILLAEFSVHVPTIILTDLTPRRGFDLVRHVRPPRKQLNLMPAMPTSSTSYLLLSTLLRLFPALFQRTQRCSYCRHIICDRGPLARKGESHGICQQCKASPTRRAHFQPQLCGLISELRDFARPEVLNLEAMKPGNKNGSTPGFMASRFHHIS